MSTISNQVKSSEQQAARQSQIAGQLSDIALPELKSLFGPTGYATNMLANFGQSGMLAPNQANLTAETGALNRDYQQAGFGLGQNIGYGALRSGESRLSPGAMNASLGSAMTTLERQRQGALSNLNFMSAKANMEDYNKLLGLMGQGVQTGFGLGGGFSQLANQAIGGLNPNSEMDQVLSAVGGIVGIAGKFV